MKTFISDIIPRLQRFSQKLDNLTLLTNQHWVVFDDIINNKITYIFRENNDLIISINGKAEIAKWEYIGNNSLLIKRNDGTNYVFKHGFFDENILALKIDSKEQYAFLVNENKYDGELNSLDRIVDFLNKKYLVSNERKKIEDKTVRRCRYPYKTDLGTLEIEQINSEIYIGQKVYLNGNKAPNGKYKLGFMWYIRVNDGEISDIVIF